MRHLADTHYMTGPAGTIYRATFSVVWRDRSVPTGRAIVHWIGCINTIKSSVPGVSFPLTVVVKGSSQLRA